MYNLTILKGIKIQNNFDHDFTVAQPLSKSGDQVNGTILLMHCFVSINRFFHSEIRAIDRVLQSMDSSKNVVETQTLLDSIQKTVAKSTKEK